MGKEAGGTVRAKIAAVKNLVSAKGHGWHGSSRLHEVLNGVERATPLSSFCPEREPVKVEWLNMLHDKLNASGRTPLNSCVIACADAVFYGQLRLGEVLPQSSLVSNYMASKFPLVSDLSIPDRFGQGHLGKLCLPCTKTHQSRGESVILINHNVKSNAVQVLTHHLEENRLLPSDPLFSYRLTNGSLQVVTKKEFSKFCNRIWSRTGIKRITGHSFRIGGTTHYLTRGIPPDVVKAMGRWKSDVFLKYWRNLDTLASIHIHRLHSKNNLHKRLQRRRTPY